MLRKTTIAAVLIICAVCAGCESPAQRKKAAREKWDKTSAQIKLTLAQQQYDEQDYDRAAKTVQQCLSADPENPAARLLYGKLLLGDGRCSEAVEQLGLALASDEKLHEAWYCLGIVRQENRDYKKAYQYYREALSLDAENVDYILAVADVQVARNNYSEALKLLTDKMTALPRDVSLKVAAADLMSLMGKNEQAVELYKQAMLLTSDNSQIAESLGYCYVFSGKWSKAANIFHKLTARCRDEQKKKLYLQVMALCSMNSSEYGRAVNCYSRLSVKQRDDAEIWLRMGQAALGAAATGRALMCGQKALALRPGYADAIALVGCAQYTDGHYKAAIKSFEKIAADKSNAGFSWLMRGRCYERLGKTGRAKRAYEKARQISPNSKLADLLAKGSAGD